MPTGRAHNFRVADHSSTDTSELRRGFKKHFCAFSARDGLPLEAIEMMSIAITIARFLAP